jgi:hypothetical protein
MPTIALLINHLYFNALIYENSFLLGARPNIPSFIDSSLDIKNGKFFKQNLL